MKPTPAPAFPGRGFRGSCRLVRAAFAAAGVRLTDYQWGRTGYTVGPTGEVVVWVYHAGYREWIVAGYGDARSPVLCVPERCPYTAAAANAAKRQKIERKHGRSLFGPAGPPRRVK